MLIPNLKARQISTGGNHSVVIDLNYDIWSFGLNYNSQLGINTERECQLVPSKLDNFKAYQVSVGAYSTIIIASSITPKL